MIKFASYEPVNSKIESNIDVLGFTFNRQPAPVVDNPVIEELPEVLTQPIVSREPIKREQPIAKPNNSKLLATDIEDIFKQAGITSINGKQIKFGSRALRDQNANYGAKNSNHKKRDPLTGYAMARDISIIGGNINDYAEFRRQIINNQTIRSYLDTKGWGILNELTPEMLAKTKGTGLHFHFGPDTSARRTWDKWKSNPNIPITQAFRKGGVTPNPTKGRFTFKKNQMVKDAERLNGKRDMRKKLVKSDVVTNKKKRIQKGQSGLKFVSYKALKTPVISEPISNPFSEYNFPSTYKEYLEKPEEMVHQNIETIQQQEPVKDFTVEAAKPVTVNHIYDNKNKWITDLKAAYKRAGITNENALKMLIAQDALESGWGKSAQGRFNYGNLTPGKSWTGAVVNGKDHDSKGNPIKQKFRSYNSIDEYASDKIQFLKALYDFDQNDNIDTFTKKLQGGNKGKRKYAGSSDYIQLVTKIYNTSKI